MTDYLGFVGLRPNDTERVPRGTLRFAGSAAASSVKICGDSLERRKRCLACQLPQEKCRGTCKWIGRRT